MRVRDRRVGIMCVTAGVLGVVLGAGILHRHLVYSPSPSIARGYYWTWPRHGGELRRGDLVVLVPPASAQALLARVAPDHAGHPWIKEVAGLPGDEVCYADAVQVNGVDRGPRALLRQLPREGRIDGCHVVPAGQVVVLGTHPWSFDSRYVGPLPDDFIIARAVFLHGGMNQ